jgi:cytochrome P450
MMIGKDGGEHARQRATVNKVFTPWRVRELESKIRERVTALTDAFIDRGECELVSEFSSPLVVHMIGDLLGVPDKDRDRLAVWADALTAPEDPDLAHMTGHEVFADSGAYLLELLTDRKAHPQHDLITALGQITIKGAPMPEGDQVGIFLQLLAAAIDSTRSTISNGTRAFIENPEQLAALRENPALAAQAMEEILRWSPPFTGFRRTANQDTEIEGVAIREGDAVMLWYVSGSRDPRAIDAPDTFDIQRTTCPHQAFGGGGRHFCLGAGLARQELLIVFEEFARRLTDIRLAEPPTRTRSYLINGYKRMPIAFNPAR